MPLQPVPDTTPYGGPWVAFYPDLSGVVTFACPDEAYEYARDKPMWVTHLAYGTDIAELTQQITAVHHDRRTGTKP